MARTTEDMKKDKKMLKKISIGDKVKYISKTGEVKTGIVSKVTEYKGRYGGLHSCRVYQDYASVTVLLDREKHINVSPRNLTIQ